VREEGDVWEALLGWLTEATVHFLDVLVREGADVYQLFDSWAGMLRRDEYERWAQPQHRAVFAEVRQVPRILFVKEGPYLDLMAATGADVGGLGTRHDLAGGPRRCPKPSFPGNGDRECRGEAAA